MSATLIGNATVIDGSGNAPFSGWILIEDDRIKAVSHTPLSVENAQFVDASGLIIAPGFIDTHAHSDLSIIAAPEAEGKIAQGITSEISGNCGLSAFPSKTDEVRIHLEELYRDYQIPIAWHDFSTYADAVANAKPAINIGFLCGHNTLRANILGYANNPGTAEEWHKEQELLREQLKQGALGLSTGLLYIPGKFASPEELDIVAAALREFDLPYATHLRSEGDALLESVEEAMRIARSGSGRLHLSHLKTALPRNWNKIDYLLEMIGNAKYLRITADRYPYTYGQTSLSVILPPPYDAMTDAKIQQTLSDSPEEVKRMKKELAEMKIEWGQIILCSTRIPGMMRFAGKNLLEIADSLKCSPAEFCADTLARDSVGTMAAFGGLSADNLSRIISQPYVCCGTDETARPLSERIGRSHPRGFGSFPRFIRLSLESGMKLEDVISRITKLPASIFNLRNRGEIRPGFYADLVLFSAEKLRDTADFGSPHRFPEGIVSVYVNGALSFADGKVCGRNGRVLKRERN